MDGELIFLLVALGISIASGINKSRKKSANSPKEPDSQTEMDDPWSTIRKYVEDARHENIPGHNPRQRQPEEVHMTGARDEENPYTAKLNEYARTKSEGARKKTSKSRVAAPVTDGPVLEEPERKDILEDFDLEKAVIYSEILRPKYEEF